MNTPRFMTFCAVLTALLVLPGLTSAEEADNSEEAAPQKSEESTTTTEAAAPAAEAVPIRRANRTQKEAKPRAQSRNPDGGGGGGGGGAVPREEPQDDPNEGENTYEPDPKQGQKIKDNMGCDMPPLHHINVHFMGGNGNRLKTDSTPIVCSTDPGTKHERYCQNTMNDDSRRCCPVKPECLPLRVACDLIVLGKDPSDGVPGPRWQYVGNDPNGGVEKHPENPFLAFSYGHGIARACSNVVKVCGEAAYKVK
jgi:hypothetical protein